jgi:hypothetical protein
MCLADLYVIRSDINCDRSSDVLDPLSLLLFLALEPSPDDGCPGPGDGVWIDGLPWEWGDVNCDDEVDFFDLLALLSHPAGLPHDLWFYCPPPDELVAVET